MPALSSGMTTTNCPGCNHDASPAMNEEFGPSHLSDHVSGCPVLVSQKARYAAACAAQAAKPRKVEPYFEPIPVDEYAMALASSSRG